MLITFGVFLLTNAIYQTKVVDGKVVNWFPCAVIHVVCFRHCTNKTNFCGHFLSCGECGQFFLRSNSMICVFSDKQIMEFVNEHRTLLANNWIRRTSQLSICSWFVWIVLRTPVRQTLLFIILHDDANEQMSKQYVLYGKERISHNGCDR